MVRVRAFLFLPLPRQRLGHSIHQTLRWCVMIYSELTRRRLAGGVELALLSSSIAIVRGRDKDWPLAVPLTTVAGKSPCKICVI